MDACKTEPRVTTSQQKIARAEDHRRRPLVPSEKNNAVSAAGRVRTRDSASRYKPGISSTPTSSPCKARRSPSAVTCHTTKSPEMSLPKRSLSADRRRPSTPPAKISEVPAASSRPSTPASQYSRPSTPASQYSRPSTPASPSSRPSTPASSSRPGTPVRDTAVDSGSSSRRLLGSRAPDGLWPSMRSLSSSFQSESVPASVAKREKVVASSSLPQSIQAPANQEPERKKTPLRGRNTVDQSENSKPLENSAARVISQHRWPGLLPGRLSANGLSRSVDLTDKVTRSALPVSSRGTSPKRMPVADGPDKGPRQRMSSIASVNGNVRVTRDMKSDINSSQPSGRSSSLIRSSRTQASPKRISVADGADRPFQQPLSVVARRLSIDGNERLEQEMKPGLISSSQPSGRSSSATRSSRIQSLPPPGLLRPSSPNKALSTSSSNSRGMLSPSRSRPSTPISPSGSTIFRAGASSSALNYIVDIRKGKDAKQVEEHHQQRLLYNVALQWHFVNAQADENLSIQKMKSENTLCSMWHSVSKLHDSVTMKKIALQHLRQELKLDTVLKKQISYLNHWVALEREHSVTLSGAVEALKASTLRLPVTGGARADTLSLKNSISSAVDVMQAMGSSICYLLTKVDGMMSLVSELSAVSAKERSLFDECRELLSSTAAMQVQESSLRTHLLQLRQDALKLE